MATWLPAHGIGQVQSTSCSSTFSMLATQATSLLSPLSSLATPADSLLSPLSLFATQASSLLSPLSLLVTPASSLLLLPSIPTSSLDFSNILLRIDTKDRRPGTRLAAANAASRTFAADSGESSLRQLAMPATIPATFRSGSALKSAPGDFHCLMRSATFNARSEVQGVIRGSGPGSASLRSLSSTLLPNLRGGAFLFVAQTSLASPFLVSLVSSETSTIFAAAVSSWLAEFRAP
mmetsp:Transcript_72845/g.144357  ORF Transcript_72845/g.144357 Transcript_72845/m.144357 type:complete len:235 (+) Transcript_72845:101-805(+)